MNCNIAVIKGDGIGPEISVQGCHTGNEGVRCSRRKVWTYI